MYTSDLSLKTGIRLRKNKNTLDLFVDIICEI